MVQQEEGQGRQDRHRNPAKDEEGLQMEEYAPDLEELAEDGQVFPPLARMARVAEGDQ